MDEGGGKPNDEAPAEESLQREDNGNTGREVHHENKDGYGDRGEYAGNDRNNSFGGNNMSSSAEPMRPVFLANLHSGYTTEDVIAIFERPMLPPSLAREQEESGRDHGPVVVDRIDVKRGYCFVFLKDAQDYNDLKRIERFVMEINGM